MSGGRIPVILLFVGDDTWAFILTFGSPPWLLLFTASAFALPRVDLEDCLNKDANGSALFGLVVQDLINHSHREVKFKGQIPVLHSYGVAHENQYISEVLRVYARSDIFTYPERVSKKVSSSLEV